MKKIIVIMLLLTIICVVMCACTNQGAGTGLTPSGTGLTPTGTGLTPSETRLAELAQTILNKASNKPYDELITENYTVYQWRQYNGYYIAALNSTMHQDEEVAVICGQKSPELAQDIIIINEYFPIECLRKTDNAIYSVHSIDEYLLFNMYEKYDIEGIKSLRANKLSIVLPKNVTLSDKEISQIKPGESRMYDVRKIDPTAGEYWYSMDCQMRGCYDLNTMLEGGVDYKEFCSKTLFSTLHYTVDGNWYKISYGLDGDRYSSVYEWYHASISSGSMELGLAGGDSTEYRVLSVEKIDAPPILEQDLPK